MSMRQILVTGLIATALSDLWQQLLKRAIGLPAGDWRLIGRWVAWMPRGVLVHRTIADSPKIAGEHAIGWLFHYAIGLAYAALYLAIIGPGLGMPPNLVSALIFGLATLVAPWFVMQPALGFGVMASRTANPVSVHFVTISTHLVFAFGLYLGSLVDSFL